MCLVFLVHLLAAAFVCRHQPSSLPSIRRCTFSCSETVKRKTLIVANKLYIVIVLSVLNVVFVTIGIFVIIEII